MPISEAERNQRAIRSRALRSRDENAVLPSGKTVKEEREAIIAAAKARKPGVNPTATIAEPTTAEAVLDTAELNQEQTQNAERSFSSRFRANRK